MTPDLAPGIRALSAVDYALDVHVPASQIQPQIAEALKRERAGMTLKGFRPGKVPASVVRKMVGPQVAIGVAEQAIGDAYREAMEGIELDVIGQPRLDELDFDVTSDAADLKAVVRFGVRPEITLADLSGVPVTRIVRAFTDEDVDADVQRRRDLGATEEDAPEGTAIAADHVAVVDIQPVSAEGEPTGVTQHGARLILANPNLRQEMRDALVGRTVGDAVTVELPHEHGDEGGHDHEEHVDRYRLTVTGLQTRVLPEPTPEWIAEQTQGRSESMDDLRDEARAELERNWERRARQAMEQKMVEEFVEAHRDSVPVPTVLTESALDTMLDEARERNGGQLPPTFEVDAFREQNRQQAEDQIRWLLVKEALIHEEGIEVTDDDLDAELAQIAGDTDVEMVRGYFQQQPQLMEQMADHLLNQRLFSALEKRFTVVDKTREDIEAEAAERRAALDAAVAADDAAAAEEVASDDAETASDEAPATEAPKKRGLFGRKKKDDA